MIKVSDVVAEMLSSDEVALEAARTGLLNLSAYADKIHKKVEKTSIKPVKKGTIVVALSRVTKQLPKTPSLTPDIQLENLRFTSSLSVLSFEKTADTMRKISVLNPFLLPVNDLFAITEGPTEVVVICSDKSKDFILKHIGIVPTAEKNSLIAVSAQLDQKAIELPNSIFTLFHALAAKRIRIVELISTHSEVSFVIEQSNLEKAISALNMYFSK